MKFMDNPIQKKIKEYIESNIGIFHEKRIESLDKLKLKYMSPV